jgi:heat shock protein HslJ
MLKRFMLIAFILMLVLAACASPTPPPVPTVAPTAPPAPTQVPTRVPPTSAPAQPVASFCDTIDPSQFRMNTMGLPYSWQSNCVPATPYDKSQPPGPVGLPEHIEINFGATNPTSQQPGDPVIYIIPKQDYIDLWTAAGDNTVADRMSQLEDLVKKQGANLPSSGIPVLPMERVTGTNDLAVQGKYLDMGTWSGIRFVGRFSQGPNAVTSTNPQLYYMVQGFAGSQDEYFVAFFYPVTTPFLPPNASAVSAEEMQRVNSDPTAYMQERATFLNGLNDASWVPNLTTLDAVVASIEYTGASTSEPIPTVIPPTAMPQMPFGQVTAPAGVNIRSGPSTAFPAVGLAPFNSTLAITGRSADGQWWVTPIQGAPNNQGWVSASWVQTFNTTNVPVVAAPPLPPTAVPTATSTPQPQATPQAQIRFWADRTTITQGECTVLRWQVSDVRAVWVYPVGQNFQDFPVNGEGSRQVCPQTTTTYEMRVRLTDDSIQTRQLTINVLPGNPLANTTWALQSLNINQLPVGVIQTINFSPASTVTGNGGCNQFNGPYTIGGQSLRIGPLATTSIACEEAVTTQESAYLQALQSTTSYELAGNQLIMRDGSGREVARFTRIG